MHKYQLQLHVRHDRNGRTLHCEAGQSYVSSASPDIIWAAANNMDVNKCNSPETLGLLLYKFVIKSV